MSMPLLKWICAFLLCSAGCSEEPVSYFGGGSGKDRLYPVGKDRWISESGFDYYTARSERCDSLEYLLKIIGSNLTAKGIQDVALSKYNGLWMEYQGYNKHDVRDEFDPALQKWEQEIAAIGDSLRVARIVVRRLAGRYRQLLARLDSLESQIRAREKERGASFIAWPLVPTIGDQRRWRAVLDGAAKHTDSLLSGKIDSLLQQPRGGYDDVHPIYLPKRGGR